MDETITIKSDLAQLARLSLLDKPEDVRLFLARLVRKYRSTDIDLANQFDHFLKSKPSRSNTPLRKSKLDPMDAHNHPVPVDEDSRLLLIKEFKDTHIDSPIFSNSVEETLSQLIQERRQADTLISAGLTPSRSAIFLGEPGVGKTLTARWLASQLQLPLYVLDLTAVMSSLLGKTGTNLRTVIDFAKERRCVLLLDEIDAIAKRRSDVTDIGELKRLVTVILQEVDSWPSTGLLLAATNYPELIDPALWRRFDLVVKFSLPDLLAIKESIKRFLGKDYPIFMPWTEVLVFAFKGESFSDIERTLQRFRKGLVLGMATASDLVEDFLSSKSFTMDRQNRIELATLLVKNTRFSQHAISNLTRVSRDTIRKYSAQDSPKNKESE